MEIDDVGVEAAVVSSYPITFNLSQNLHGSVAEGGKSFAALIFSVMAQNRRWGRYAIALHS